MFIDDTLTKHGVIEALQAVAAMGGVVGANQSRQMIGAAVAPNIARSLQPQFRHVFFRAMHEGRTWGLSESGGLPCDAENSPLC